MLMMNQRTLSSLSTIASVFLFCIYYNVCVLYMYMYYLYRNPSVLRNGWIALLQLLMI